jgi:diaminopimelate epimerase
VNGCVRPEACASAEARARVAALLEGRSLDELVAMASAAAERGPLPPSSDGDG